MFHTVLDPLIELPKSMNLGVLRSVIDLGLYSSSPHSSIVDVQVRFEDEIIVERDERYPKTPEPGEDNVSPARVERERVRPTGRIS